MNPPCLKYAVITPARNEERFIEKTIQSMVAQTQLPEVWVIVDDGSTDRTAEIVEQYSEKNSFIKLLRRPKRTERTFAGKAEAFNEAFETIKQLDIDVLGNLDADISFEPDYMEFLLEKFESDPKLGVAGTAMREINYDSRKDSYYSDKDVFGACQLFRISCFRDVGGYTPVRWGGLDWIAVRTARLNGWRTCSFRERPFFHHRPMGETESNVWKARFEYGMKDHYLGNHPLWQFLRVGYQMFKRPYFLGAAVLFCGYAYSFFIKTERPITPELMKFHRREQLDRLKMFLRHSFKFSKTPIDNTNNRVL